MAIVEAADLNRSVLILERRAVQEDVYGTQSVEWVPMAESWAQVRDMLPSRAERIAEGIQIANRPARVRMRWRTDVTAAHRLELDDGRLLRIVSQVAELGRREGIEFMVEELTTEGDEP